MLSRSYTNAPLFRARNSSLRTSKPLVFYNPTLRAQNSLISAPPPPPPAASLMPPSSSVVSPIPFTNDWNAIIRGYAQSHNPINAVTCYLSMSRSPCKPDALTCSFFLKACARALARIETLQMHAHVVKFGFGADVLLRTTLLDAYAKCGDLDNSRNMFDEMSQRDIASWNALILGLAQGNKPHEALELFKEMREGKIYQWNMMPNEVTCSRMQNFDENVIVCNAVIDMYAKCGFVEKAYKVFEGMRCSRNLVTWNTMIMAFAIHGDGVKALELFNSMGRHGIGPEPDRWTVDEGVRLFELMEERGVSKNVKHYGTVVDLLGRAGRLDEAYEIIESMPIFPDAVLWQTLLGASKIYGNVEMAENASRKLVEMGSSHCGDFVLLSNVYAAHKRWNDVGRVREAMKNRDVKKVPGFSYIELNGTIYKFYNGDQSHPDWKQIYTKLEEIRI
ncbi:Pentatricopeptide repeat-containing protein [Forsythia ovata]|uniref:Pentatricopeptide repeat-containing protein n=1 Tax=Forsythia ovata TaxID=205694 RepID=A0ABD1PX69_9LAMI